MSKTPAAILDGLIPLVILIGLTVPFWVTPLDLHIATRFYTPGVGWPIGGHQPWLALKHYGVLPAWLVTVSALVVFIASFRAARWRPHRRAALYLVLVMAIGPGLVVNSVFKQHWGRPRPRDLVQFGGDREYVKPWVPRPPQYGGSFASGHAATGFYLLTPFFLYRRRARGKAVAFLLLGLSYGTLVGIARIAQGKHFASDVLWALGFVYLTAWALARALHLETARDG